MSTKIKLTGKKVIIPMNQAQHTPGPWHVFNRYNDDAERVDAIYSNEDGVKIATVERWRGLLPEKEAEANARLIAASPELLALCKKALAHLRGEVDETATDAMGAFEAELAQAIARAEGREG